MKKHLPLQAILFILTLVYHRTNAQTTFDTVSFETPTTKIIIDIVGNNLWQIGKPQKTYFDTAHSGTNAILTDTLNAYPPNDTSSFIYVIRNPFTQTCLTCMEFWHQYDMDSLADQGIIDASYDGGDSWVVVKDTFIDNLGAYFNWRADYHANTGNYTGHPLITSGKSDGWIQSGFCWQWFLPVGPDTIIINPDSLMIRFTFISDSLVENKEGWMIDDILTSSAPPEGCTSTKESYQNEKVTVYPNPFSTQTIIQTENVFKNASLTVFNSLGHQVKQLKDISGQTIILSRDYLPSGFYFLQLTQANKTLRTFKIVITD